MLWESNCACKIASIKEVKNMKHVEEEQAVEFVGEMMKELF